jgi:hypothetical protein
VLGRVDSLDHQETSPASEGVNFWTTTADLDSIQGRVLASRLVDRQNGQSAVCNSVAPSFWRSPQRTELSIFSSIHLAICIRSSTDSQNVDKAIPRNTAPHPDNLNPRIGVHPRPARQRYFLAQSYRFIYNLDIMDGSAVGILWPSVVSAQSGRSNWGNYQWRTGTFYREHNGTESHYVNPLDRVHQL